MELVAECALANHELCCIGAIKAVNAIRSSDAILHGGDSGLAISILEESSGGDDLFRDILKNAYDILISGLGGARHVPRFVDNPSVDRKELIEVVDSICEFLKKL